MKGAGQEQLRPVSDRHSLSHLLTKPPFCWAWVHTGTREHEQASNANAARNARRPPKLRAHKEYALKKTKIIFLLLFPS